jgi:chromate transporter
MVAPMKEGTGILATLAIQFAVLSLLAVGGANALVPELRRQAIDVHDWMSARQFADMFAIAQVTPGQNVILVTLIGHVAELAGALVANAAMCGPTCLVAYFVRSTWEHSRPRAGASQSRPGLVPVSIGLLGAGAILLARVADHNWIRVGRDRRHGRNCLRQPAHPALAVRPRGLLGLIGLI